MSNHRFVYYSLQCPAFIDILKTSPQNQQFLDTYYELCRTSMVVISDPEKNAKRRMSTLKLPEISISKVDQSSSKIDATASNLSVVDSVSNNHVESFDQLKEPENSANQNTDSNTSQLDDGQKAEKSSEVTEVKNESTDLLTQNDKAENVGDESKPESKTTQKEAQKSRVLKRSSISVSREDFRRKQNNRSRDWKGGNKNNDGSIWSKSNVKMRERTEKNLKTPKTKTSAG